MPFNKPFIGGKEIEYIQDAVESGKISGDGKYSKLCQAFLQDTFGFTKVLLTTSCTDALEMTALLLDIKEGDEVIMPSFNFVSAANAFSLRGAKIVFADIDPKTLNISFSEVEKLVSGKTRAIVLLHYAGVACEMEKFLKLSDKLNIPIIEDVALAFDSYYNFADGRSVALGNLGSFGTFSFHETKNIISGEGGALIVNSVKNIERAEIIREKGTNRSKLFRGEVDKYTWNELGSSFLPSEITAAFLFGQLENYRKIQAKRKMICTWYIEMLKELNEKGCFDLPYLPSYATSNGSVFYLICSNESERNQLISFLLEHNIKAVFHYLPLHLSPYYLKNSKIYKLPVTEDICGRIIRLPLFYDLQQQQVELIVSRIKQFFIK